MRVRSPAQPQASPGPAQDTDHSLPGRGRDPAWGELPAQPLRGVTPGNFRTSSPVGRPSGAFDRGPSLWWPVLPAPPDPTACTSLCPTRTSAGPSLGSVPSAPPHTHTPNHRKEQSLTPPPSRTSSRTGGLTPDLPPAAPATLPGGRVLHPRPHPPSTTGRWRLLEGPWREVRDPPGPAPGRHLARDTHHDEHRALAAGVLRRRRHRSAAGRRGRCVSLV